MYQTVMKMMRYDNEYDVDSILKCRLSKKRPNKKSGEHTLPLKQQLQISEDANDYEFSVEMVWITIV